MKTKPTAFGLRIQEALQHARLDQPSAAAALTRRLKKTIPPQTVQYLCTKATKSAYTGDVAAITGTSYSYLALGRGTLTDGRMQNAAARALIADIEAAADDDVPEPVFDQIREMLPGLISGAMKMLSKQQPRSVDKSFGGSIDSSQEDAQDVRRTNKGALRRGIEEAQGNN